MTKLDPEVTILFFIKNCLHLIFVIPVWFIFVLLCERYFAILPVFFDAVGFLVLLAGILVSYLWAYLTYTSYSYTLTHDSLTIQHGFIIPRKTKLAYNQIIDIEYYLDPIITRFFGIYNLHIETNEAFYADGLFTKAKRLTIPGLTQETAQDLKTQLVMLSHQHVAERKYYHPETGQFK